MLGIIAFLTGKELVKGLSSLEDGAMVCETLEDVAKTLNTMALNRGQMGE